MKREREWEKGGDGGAGWKERGEKGEEEDWVRERADTGFAWSVRLVGKTTGRGRLQRLTLVCVCVFVCVFVGTSVVSVGERVGACVRACVRTRGPGYETLTGI